MIDADSENQRLSAGVDAEIPTEQAEDSLATRFEGRDNLRANQAESTAPEDSAATRSPVVWDTFATRADSSSENWINTDSPSSSFGRVPEGTPRYQIIRPHARGALGEVFVARDGELNREVALKEMKERFVDDASSRTRFVLEAEVTGGLEHPGIVPVYGFGYHADGRPYYAMRFVRGSTLKEAIDQHHSVPKNVGERQLELRTLLGRFATICNAIAYAHSRGVLHRDIKPGNIMLGPYGETLVVDWGLAKSVGLKEEDACIDDRQPHDEPLRPLSGDSSSATVMGSVVGTPAFMSPEQAAGHLDRLGPPSDIYSLGATLYVLLTGKIPYEGKDMAEILNRVRTGGFLSPRLVRQGIPRPLEAICLKAMALQPADRYPTAKLLATDIEKWLAGSPISAYRDWYVVRFWRWCFQRRLLSMFGFVLFIDLLYLVDFLLLFIQSVLKIADSRFPRLNLAAGVLILAPLVGQLGALFGAGLGASICLATRRTKAGVIKGARLGLKVGVAVALLALIVSGTFEATHPPNWTDLASRFVPEEWPRLPGAVTLAPHWVKKPSVPVEIRLFFDQPPGGDNAASDYLDALSEFDGNMALCFPLDEGSRRREIAQSRMVRIGKLEQAWRLDPSTVDRNALDKLLDDYKVGFLKLQAAQAAYHRCVFQAGFGDRPQLPHVKATREVVRVAVLRAARKLERVEIRRAIEDFEVVLRLCRDIRSRGVLSTQITSLETEAQAETEILLPILHHRELTAEDCDKLLAILQAHVWEGLDPFVEGSKAEYVRFGQILHACLDPKIGVPRSEASLAAVALDPATRSKVEEFLGATPPLGFVESAHRAYDEFHRTIHAHQDKTLLERIEHASRLPPLTMAPHHHEVLRLAPDVGSFLRAIARAEATRNAMKCLVALRRWELSSQPFSEGLSLEEVVKASGMAKVPPDPFRIDGGPLKLRIDPSGPIIESVGPITRDNLLPGLSYRLRPTVGGR